MRGLLACLVGFGLSGTAAAEVVSSGPGHYHLAHEANSDLDPDALWARLIKPSAWWDPEHTYSGDSNNLKLKARAGGLWQESWDGGSVAHGHVLGAIEGKELVLDAPFGPLQKMAVQTVWVITIEPAGNGSKVTFTEQANGAAESNLDQLAPAVDFVKQNAIERLVAGE